MRFRKEKYIDQSQSNRSGKWTFRVRVNGITKTFNEDDYGDASAAFKNAKKFRDNVLANEYEIVYTNKTVNEVYELSYDMFPVRFETKRKQDCLFNKYCNCKNKDITKIRTDDILLDLNNMIEIATDNTIQRVFSLWRKIIKTAIYKEFIIKDYSLMVKCPKSHINPIFSTNKITDRQTIINIQNLLKKHLKSSHDRYMIPLFIELLYLTGIRICEGLALTRNDITDVISINKEIGSSIDEKMVVRKCKTELSNRTIPITKEIKDVLDKAMTFHKYDYIFCDKNGLYYNSTYLGDKIHKIAKKNGYNFNLYSIRHLFATDLTIAGVDDRTRMELMGHSNIKTNLGYARSNDKLKKNALDNR